MRNKVLPGSSLTQAVADAMKECAFSIVTFNPGKNIRLFPHLRQLERFGVGYSQYFEIPPGTYIFEPLPAPQVHGRMLHYVGVKSTLVYFGEHTGASVHFTAESSLREVQLVFSKGGTYLFPPEHRALIKK